MTNNVRSYSEMVSFETFEERFDYLKLRASVGDATFGFDRHLNQGFYRSQEWRSARDIVIVRDLSCDLGVPGYDIFDKVIIHHMNPMTPEEIDEADPDILNPEYLVVVSHNTHNAIHFGDSNSLISPIVERQPGDTILW